MKFVEVGTGGDILGNVHSHQVFLELFGTSDRMGGGLLGGHALSVLGGVFIEMRAGGKSWQSGAETELVDPVLCTLDNLALFQEASDRRRTVRLVLVFLRRASLDGLQGFRELARGVFGDREHDVLKAVLSLDTSTDAAVETVLGDGGSDHCVGYFGCRIAMAF